MISSAVSPGNGAAAAGTFRVLVVCTANLCRSPMAEFLLRAQIPQAAGWDIQSAGTRATPGALMHPRAAAVLRERGHDVGRFRTTELDASLVSRAHLVLTAERAHTAHVLRLYPAAVQYTFTLRQFARLLDRVAQPPARPGEIPGSWLVAQARANRSGRDPRQQRSDDVEDPMGRRTRAFRRCADLLDQVAMAIASPMRGDR